MRRRLAMGMGILAYLVISAAIGLLLFLYQDGPDVVHAWTARTTHYWAVHMEPHTHFITQMSATFYAPAAPPISLCTYVDGITDYCPFNDPGATPTP